jgi:hypothetical protein
MVPPPTRRPLQENSGIGRYLAGHVSATQAKSKFFVPVLLAQCWPREKLKPVEEFPPGLFRVIFAEMLALLPFSVALGDYTLVTLDP